MLADYGHRIVDPEIGIFYSRFTPEELQRIDRERGTQAGQAYRLCPAAGSSSRFRKAISPAVDPFLHEAGLHLIRRNDYVAVLPGHRNDPADYAFHARVAWAENRILEKYFSNTLQAAGEVLPAEQVQQLRRAARLCRGFESTVSNHIITVFTRRQAMAATGTLLLLCIAGDVAAGIALRRRHT